MLVICTCKPCYCTDTHDSVYHQGCYRHVAYPAAVVQAYMLTRCVSHIRVHTVIVKASSGPRYVVGCRNKVDKAKLIAGTRVALDMTTLTIMRALPREVNLPGCMLQHLQSSLGFWKHQHGPMLLLY